VAVAARTGRISGNHIKLRPRDVCPSDIYSTWFLGPDSYLVKSGTSMAAPHVSGLAALIWSRWPDWSNIEVSRQITETAADIDSPGWDPRTGWGRLDAAAALDASISHLYVPLMIYSP
jgi:subtilisin family serine protease